MALGSLCAKELNISVNIATLQNAPVQIALQSIILFHNHDCGSDENDNLALACRRCNKRRYNFTTSVDPQTQQEVALFNPRQQLWVDHFIWTGDGLKIIGKSATGRATCHRLDINDEFHNQGFIQESRQLWIQGGWHPPVDDPRL